MKFAPRHLSLTAKILLLSLCNLALLCGAGLIFLHIQFGSGESILLGPASGRMMRAAKTFMADVSHAPRPEWDALLARVGKEHQANAYLTGPEGQHIAGPLRPLPQAVIENMRHDGGPPLPAGQELPATPPPPVFLALAGEPLHYWVVARVRVPDAPRGAMLAMEVDSIFNPALFFDWRLLAGIGLTLVALSFLCWFSFVRHLTGSIRQMEADTERIAEGRFDAVAAVDRGDELGQLSAQINRMARRLTTLVNGQKRFLGDIAHELCAPIARMQLAMSILDQRADERGRESLADLREEVDHISDLVNELLQFSKAALRPEAVKVESLDVAAVVSRVISREAAPHTRVDVRVAPGLHVLANEIYFARSLGNLLRNSIRYAGDAGPVEIGAQPDEDQVVITVADQGPGVAEHELERILEPFYRRDESRSRNTGGAGLGLAIVKAGIESCHGSVKCRNRQPHGLEVTIRLPAPGRA